MLPAQRPEVTDLSLYKLTWSALNLWGHREELPLKSTQTVQLFNQKLCSLRLQSFSKKQVMFDLATGLSASAVKGDTSLLLDAVVADISTQKQDLGCLVVSGETPALQKGRYKQECFPSMLFLLRTWSPGARKSGFLCCQLRSLWLLQAVPSLRMCQPVNVF